MNAPTIVFDLDGTLIDTAPDLVETLNVIFAREGLAPLPYETTRNLVGGGAEHLADRSRPFPGVTDALDVLAARGCQFAVCTNKLERLSVLLLNELKLADRFVAICGQDTFGVQKPNPDVLRRTIAAAGGTLQGAVMIGDSITDIRTARAAGVPIIAVDFGYSERPIAEFSPNRTISHFTELPASIAAVLSAF